MKRAPFQVALALGILLAVIIYGLRAEDLSEGEMVLLSPFWFLPIMFGVHGLVVSMKAPERALKKALVATAGWFFALVFFFTVVFPRL